VLSEKTISEKLFELFIKNSALGEFEGQIRELISLCKSEEEVRLLFHSLNHMIVLNHKQLSFGLRLMSDFASEEANSHGKIAIVATAYDSGSDGSQLVLYMLKPELDRNLDIKLFNTVPSYLRKMKDYPHFILIDDFSGTGSTIINRLEYIAKDAKSRDIDASGSVCLIAAMEKAKTNIEERGFNLRIFKELKAGISGYFSGKELENANKQMLRLESELNPSIGERNLPSFGYGGAEALYFLHPGNAPNSNFPIFWWPEDRTGQSRKTIMKRYEL